MLMQFETIAILVFTFTTTEYTYQCVCTAVHGFPFRLRNYKYVIMREALIDETPYKYAALTLPLSLCGVNPQPYTL